MTLTFFTNLIHHHQVPLADEFYKLLGDNYHYVAMEPLPEWLIKGGYDPTIDRPYIIRAYESEEASAEAKRLMLESDVVIAAYSPEEELLLRKAQNKITFDYSERWNKDGGLHLIDPRRLTSIYKRSFKFRKSRIYMLCASAYAARDVNFYHCYPSKTFKWGYMTKVDMNYSRPFLSNVKRKISLMWCARFLDLKHPELPIKLAKLLKDKGYNFHLDMYGNGVMFDEIVKLANQLEVNDVLSFCGNVPNEQILKEMREHDIFLFTSDRGEGWGVVANEAMVNGCVLVGSDEIGSIPFLIKDGENGLIFKSKNISSLTDKVEWAFNHLDDCEHLSANAIKTMQEIWSPANAARSFLQLVDDLQNCRKISIIDGPCSRAK